MTAAPTPPPAGMPDPVALLRDRRYLGFLAIGAVIGAPVATVAYFFLKLVGEAQQYVFQTLPADLGFDRPPSWWASTSALGATRSTSCCCR